jgi:serine/threonine protein kinase
MLEASANGRWKRAKLCDFGSAKLTSRASTPAPGAAIYSAPEILPATKGKQTVKVDVYSFGVLYCETLLACLPPNLDPTAADFSKFISDLKRLEGKDIHQTAHICTNKNPKKRPTMKDVLQDIDQHIVSSNTV